MTIINKQSHQIGVSEAGLELGKLLGVSNCKEIFECLALIDQAMNEESLETIQIRYGHPLSWSSDPQAQNTINQLLSQTPQYSQIQKIQEKLFIKGISLDLLGVKFGGAHKQQLVLQKDDQKYFIKIGPSQLPLNGIHSISEFSGQYKLKLDLENLSIPGIQDIKTIDPLFAYYNNFNHFNFIVYPYLCNLSYQKRADLPDTNSLKGQSQETIRNLQDYYDTLQADTGSSIGDIATRNAFFDTKGGMAYLFDTFDTSYRSKVI